ncbi:MAG: OmpA family protein [Pseudomonadota bacterium]|nr:OmpA family protein [Pseudomonadota bacterium]
MARRRRPGHRPEEPENHERWLISYADFITLLFAFFVVMYATAQRNPEKEKQFEKSIRKYLYEVASFGGEGAGDSGTGTLQVSLGKKGPAELKDLIARELKPISEGADGNSIVEEITHDSLGVRIRLVASGLFRAGSAKLNDSAFEPLKQIGEILEKMDGKIIIEGHTDNTPIKTREFPSNWELSSARATRLVRHLIEWQGLTPNKILAVAYADQKPLVPNNNEKNRAKNRRIEIFITSKDEL